MAWRLARSLEVLRDEVLALHPGTTVWTIGDNAHRNTWSDHNPNSADVVCASDTLGDRGLDLGWYAERVRQAGLAGHPSPKYVIFNRRIASRNSGWTWRTYTGSNPHTGHVHVSVGTGPDGRSTGPYDDTSPWGLATREDDVSFIGLKVGDPRDAAVRELQMALRRAGHDPGALDGDYGPKTAAAVLACRKSRGSSVTSGDSIDSYGSYQIRGSWMQGEARPLVAAATRQLKAALEAALAELPASGLPAQIVIDLPDTITVPIEPADEG